MGDKAVFGVPVFSVGLAQDVPTKDLPVFTTGVLPIDESGRTDLIKGVQPALEALGGGLDDYVLATGAALEQELSGRLLEINELGKEVAERIGPTLADDVRAVWEANGPYAPGQPLGEGVVHFCLRILTLQQVLCFAAREGRTAPFVLLSEWLDDVPRMPAADACRELAIRYLRAYGPATTTGLACWLGVAPSDVAAWWDLTDGDLVPVDLDGFRSWVLADDVETLKACDSTEVEGVRLLPASDPFLRPPDRDVLVPDRKKQRHLWRPLHAPGALLVRGEVVGTWRGRKRSGRLDIAVEPWQTLPRATRTAVEDEAQSMALVRGTEKATVSFGEELR